MASPYFDFKQFRVHHQKSAMKVGTDSVVLGALCTLKGHEDHLLDIGTGSGILSLMLAQKSRAQIHAIEIDPDACEEARHNFEASKWKDRLSIYHQSIQEYTATCGIQFDCIISNPPYFGSKSSFEIKDLPRKAARQDAELGFDLLATCVKKLLHEQGKFWLILPPLEAELFRKAALEAGLFPTEEIRIIPSPEKPVKRLVQAYTHKKTNRLCRDLILLQPDLKRTEAYDALTKDYYLDLQNAR